MKRPRARRKIIAGPPPVIPAVPLFGPFDSWRRALVMVGLVLIYRNSFVFLGRFVCLPLIDWIWEALGNQFVSDEPMLYRRGGRRKLTSCSACHDGVVRGFILWIGAAALLEMGQAIYGRVSRGWR